MLDELQNCSCLPLVAGVYLLLFFFITHSNHFIANGYFQANEFGKKNQVTH